jgi:TonB family protein
VEDSERALKTCAELEVSAQFNLMTFNPDTTLDTLRSDVAFMRRFCGNPLNFCRTELYAGTPLEKRMIELGRARGDYQARGYSLIDPVADLACSASLKLFHARCWSTGSLMQNAIGLDHAASVLKRFYRGSQREALAGRIQSWLRSVNLDTVNLLDEIIELSASSGGRKNAGFEKAVRDVAERESLARGEFLSEMMTLAADLHALRLPIRARQNNQAPLLWARFAKPAAAALLAIGIPTTTLDQQAIAQQSQTAPPASTAGQEKGTCSLAGRVVDPNGGVVPGTKITITNEDTGAIRTLTTGNTGEYVANDLAAGHYALKADAAGFKIALRTGVVLKAGARERIEFGLAVGDIGCCEYVVGALDAPNAEINLSEKKKPFAYVVGQANDHGTFQGIAKLVYDDSEAWIQVFEANREVAAKPGVIPYGTTIFIPPKERLVPELIFKVTPLYPPSARKEQIWGDVLMDVTLKGDGTVRRTSVIEGNPLLVKAAIRAVKQWRYRTLLVNGKPVLKFVVVISFDQGGKIR